MVIKTEQDSTRLMVLLFNKALEQKAKAWVSKKGDKWKIPNLICNDR